MQDPMRVRILDLQLSLQRALSLLDDAGSRLEGVDEPLVGRIYAECERGADSVQAAAKVLGEVRYERE